MIKPKFKIRRIGKGARQLPPKIVQALKYSALCAVTVILMTLVYFHEQTGDWFKASVLEAPQAFNGTVLPVSKVPDWTHWGGANNTTYSEVDPSMLINLPEYNLSKMAFPNEDLVWGNTEHDKIRNMKITYSVVYLGNYELDHKENAGSHLAVDIKMPVGTPIYSVANGKVVKTSTQSDGFGHHIVIKHPNVPDPDDPTKKTTLYSCYVHMDAVNVSEGQNVLKGEQIGTSGNTGTSTTPHLHFQIDNDLAPWHPYWPFTYAEYSAAGLSFFDAINAGLGMENARKYTTNPMTYVYKYLGAYSLASNDSGGIVTDTGNSNNNADSEDQETSDGSQDTQTGQEDPEVEVIENPDETGDQTDTSLFSFKLIGESTSLINNGVSIIAVDELQQLDSLPDDTEIRVELNGVGRLTKKTFKKSDFKQHSIKFSVNSSEPGIANILIGKSSYQINFIEKTAGAASLKIEHDGYFQSNIMEELKIIALDADGNSTPTVNFSGTVNVTAETGNNVVIIPEQLSVQDFENGEATVHIKVPSGEDRVVIRAQNGALVGESDAMGLEDKQVFDDVPRGHENYTAIKYLYDNEIINGYSDGTFKPDKTVNRVEALKMLMLAFDIPEGSAASVNFTDTESGAWYANALGAAVNKGIVNGYEDGTFRPDKIVNKAEYLKMLFATNDIDVTEKLTANPYADVPKDAWYAPYAYLTNRKNILDVKANRLRPDTGMTRGSVAETIYRLKYIMDHNLVTYSK